MATDRTSNADDWASAQQDTEAAEDLGTLQTATRIERSPAESARTAQRYRDAADFLRDQADTLHRGAATILNTLSEVVAETLADDKRRTSEESEDASPARR